MRSGSRSTRGSLVRAREWESAVGTRASSCGGATCARPRRGRHGRPARIHPRLGSFRASSCSRAGEAPPGGTRSSAACSSRSPLPSRSPWSRSSSAPRHPRREGCALARAGGSLAEPAPRRTGRGSSWPCRRSTSRRRLRPRTRCGRLSCGRTSWRGPTATCPSTAPRSRPTDEPSTTSARTVRSGPAVRGDRTLARHRRPVLPERFQLQRALRGRARSADGPLRRSGDGEEPRVIPVDHPEFEQQAITPDGTRALIEGDDRFVQLWGLRKEGAAREVPGGGRHRREGLY